MALEVKRMEILMVMMMVVMVMIMKWHNVVLVGTGMMINDDGVVGER